LESRVLPDKTSLPMMTMPAVLDMVLFLILTFWTWPALDAPPSIRDQIRCSS
jgi:hypothetical protein